MAFPTKRSIEARIDALEKERAEETAEEGPIEVLSPFMFDFGSGLGLTERLASQGFVVERKGGASDATVGLETTPPAGEVFHEILWHFDGPTAAKDDVRIVWDDDRLEAVLENAEHPVEYESPDLPKEPVVVDDGEGWKAVAPADRVVENMILKRSNAEKWGYEILGPAPSWIENTDDFDLVEVDAEPVPVDERRPD